MCNPRALALPQPKWMQFISSIELQIEQLIFYLNYGPEQLIVSLLMAQAFTNASKLNDRLFSGDEIEACAFKFNRFFFSPSCEHKTLRAGHPVWNDSFVYNIKFNWPKSVCRVTDDTIKTRVRKKKWSMQSISFVPNYVWNGQSMRTQLTRTRLGAIQVHISDKQTSK